MVKESDRLGSCLEQLFGPPYRFVPLSMKLRNILPIQAKCYLMISLKHVNKPNLMPLHLITRQWLEFSL